MELSQATAKAMGVEHRVTHLEKRNEVQQAYATHEKLKCFFNPPPPTPLETGLARSGSPVPA